MGVDVFIVDGEMFILVFCYGFLFCLLSGLIFLGFSFIKGITVLGRNVVISVKVGNKKGSRKEF